MIPNGINTAMLGRGGTQREVAIQQKLNKENNSDIDPLLALSEEIADSFQAKRLKSYTQAIWSKTDFRAIYSAEHLQ